MNPAIIAHIEQQFKSRLEASRQQGKSLKPGSVAYRAMQTEFFTGAMAALVAVVNQPPDTIEQIFNAAAGSNPEIDSNYQQTLNGKAMPPKWVFSIMRGDDILSQ